MTQGIVKLVRTAALALAGTLAAPAAEHAAGMEFFEKKIRPVLVETCYKCHSTGEKVKGFYEANAGEFKQPERLRLQQVVFPLRNPSGTPMTEIEKKEKRDRAELLVARARKGECVAAWARQ